MRIERIYVCVLWGEWIIREIHDFWKKPNENDPYSKLYNLLAILPLRIVSRGYSQTHEVRLNWLRVYSIMYVFCCASVGHVKSVEQCGGGRCSRLRFSFVYKVYVYKYPC